MNNVREHWDEIKDIRSELINTFGENGGVYLMSLKRRKQGIQEGQVSVCNIQIAAMCIAQETHRLAKPEEIESFKVRQEENSRAIQAEKAKKDSKVNINIGDQLAEVLARIALQNNTVAAVVTEVPAATPAPTAAPTRASQPPPKQQPSAGSKTFE